MLNEARTLVGKKKTAATGKARGVSLKAAPGKTTKAAVEKYGTTRKLSGSSSSGTIKKVAKKQPETKSTPVQTKEKAKGGILGALKARAQKDIESVRQSVNTARQVGARRAAEVKATYDAVRAKGKEAEKSAAATRARRQATVAVGRAAQSAGRTAVKAAGAAGAAAGQAVAAKKSGKTTAQAAGRAAGTFVRKMTKEEKELLARYFIESEIAFNYDEVQEIFENIDQEHFEYHLDRAISLYEENSSPSALDIIHEKLSVVYNTSDFQFSDWRHLTEKNSEDEATGKFVNITNSNRTDREPNIKGKKKDGVIINPQINMTDEKAPPEAAKAAIQGQQRMKTQQQMQRKQLMLQQQRLQMQKQGKLPVGNMEEVEHLDELNRYEKEKGKDYKTGKSVTKGGTIGGDDTNSKVMRHMHKIMGAGRMGAGGAIQLRGQKKVAGKKPPTAGEYGSERRSPEQIVKNRRAAAQRAKDNMSSRFD